ncbi:MAG: radical SAM protein, partial [Desulfobulbaceae bacterium]|nr:radical SAM protein [Desulfobulbaceae bacterium]
TNGILATDEKIAKLADAGLDEIRFDISADAYTLDHLRLAAGRIPTITVEIPAIPEDKELLANLLPTLADTGVHHLNLHQLRCTPHNLPHLVKRPYTMLHGNKVTVLDSELTALELLVKALDKGHGPAINYCSYAYKSRFQGRAARLRAAGELVKPWEEITEAGYIRTLCLKGEPEVIARCAEQLANRAGESVKWRVEGGRDLFFHPEMWSMIDFTGLSLHLNYATSQIRGAISYRGAHRKINLNRKRDVVAERWPAYGNRILTFDERERFGEILTNQGGDNRVDFVLPQDIRDFEVLPAGLLDYHFGLETF